MAYETIKVDKAFEFYQRDPNALFLDVRTEAEWTGPCGHIDRALLIPIQELPQRLAELEPHKGRPILAFCYTGVRSKKACELLAAAGFTSLYNVIGGMMEWFDRDYPRIPGRPTPDMPEC